jgi:hypothetical protein
VTPEINTFEENFISARRARALLALLAALFAMWCVCSVLLPHDRYIRYQQLSDSDLFRSRWVYERIHYDRTPIDVAIIGNSRVEAAISAPELERKLSAKFGRPIHVANLAIPEEGRNLHYLVARELLESHPENRIILLSVAEQANVTHPAFRYLGDVRDLLGAPLFVNHYYFLDAAFLPYRQMSYFAQTLFPSSFGESLSFRKDYRGTGFDTTYSFYLPSGKLVDRYSVIPAAKLAAVSQKMVEDLGGKWRPPSRWYRLNNPLETEYTKRLVDLAKRHRVETIFVRLPFYNDPAGAYDQEFYRKLGPLLDAQQFSQDTGYYADTGHFNRIGIDHISPWLIRVIDPYLGPLQNGSLARPSDTRETAHVLRQASVR